MLQQDGISEAAVQKDAILTPGVTADYRGGVLELTISGDIDHHSAGGLRQKVDREIYFYRPKTVRMKLGEVDFMDSSGLGFFMGRYQLCKSLAGTFVLVDPPPRVLRILELSGMDKRLSIEKIYHAPKKEGHTHDSGKTGEKRNGENPETGDTESAALRIFGGIGK